MGAAAWQGPGEGAWPGLVQVPAGCLLGAVVAAAQRAHIAFAGASALVIGDRVVVVAADGGSPASAGIAMS